MICTQQGTCPASADGICSRCCLCCAQGIISHLKLTHPRDLLRWAYHDQDWSHIAALAPLVVDCATQGDAVADTILKHGVGELFRWAAGAAAGLPAGAHCT
jgi:N-acetylglucosamine kinase-like BadF-type ATPase